MKRCLACDKQVEDYLNYCDWDCHVEAAKQAGGVMHCPNGLPVRCITRDNLMIECEHGDHPDYKFPVTLQYTGTNPQEDFQVMHGDGTIEPMSDEMARDRMQETHALIYTDGSIALTMYECGYGLWSLRDGKFLSGPAWMSGGLFRLTDESLEKVRSLRDERSS